MTRINTKAIRNQLKLMNQDEEEKKRQQLIAGIKTVAAQSPAERAVSNALAKNSTANKAGQGAQQMRTLADTIKLATLAAQQDKQQAAQIANWLTGTVMTGPKSGDLNSYK